MSEHYFSAQPSGESARSAVTARVWGGEMRLATAGGVFSHGRLDIGTSVLLRAMDPPTRPGVFLDLGCGYGAIACALAMAVPDAKIYAVDVNQRALELCNENAATYRISDRVVVCRPEAVSEDVRFDEIWSNPPIRIGKNALHSLLQVWLGRLRPAGRAVLVVGKNLGADSLQRWLGDQGHPCERLASAKGFRVLEVKPRR